MLHIIIFVEYEEIIKKKRLFVRTGPRFIPIATVVMTLSDWPMFFANNSSTEAGREFL